MSCHKYFIQELLRDFLFHKSQFRTLDGSQNNNDHPEYGNINTPLVRLFNHDYSNGINGLSGQNRPNPREISNHICDQKQSYPNSKCATNILWLWGQFIDHDITLVGSSDEKANISVPTGDPYFDPQSTGEKYIPFCRSAIQEGTGVGNTPREMLNQLTPFIDASNVYGSTQERNNYIREFKCGKLKTSHGNMLPVGDGSIENAGHAMSAIYVGGDVRANEHVGLISIHTLFVREHNWWAEEINKKCDNLSDEDIYQIAKVIVEAEIQAITFNEFLPTLLGGCNVDDYDGYDSEVNPQVSHLFSVCCYRLHSLITSEPIKNMSLKEQFFSSYLMSNKLTLEKVFKNYFNSKCEELDPHFVDDLRNFLFGPPGAGGHDLAALNIQRGRDHCLPDYNTVRANVGLGKKNSFNEISCDNELNLKLKNVYGDINDIDVFIAGICEKKYNSCSMLGQLFHKIVIEQFYKIRSGDKFWYENRLSKSQIKFINNVKLSDIIKRNTDLRCVPDNVFVY
jgi:peroxidase